MAPDCDCTVARLVRIRPDGFKIIAFCTKSSPSGSTCFKKALDLSRSATVIWFFSLLLETVTMFFYRYFKQLLPTTMLKLHSLILVSAIEPR